MEYLFFLIPAAVIALAFILYFRRENVRAKQSPATQKKQAIIDSLKVQTRTASGVRTSARQTPAAAFLAAIDEAFDLGDKLCASKGWTNKIDRSRAEVLIFPSVRDFDSNNNYNPAFQVFLEPNDPYNGSIYDKGGYILAAEEVLQLQNPVVFVVADYYQNFDDARRANFHGIEHCLYEMNAPARHAEIKDHSQGGGHPFDQVEGY